MAAFLDRRKILFNGVEVRGIRREEEQRVTGLLDQCSRRFRFMKGGIIHNEDRVGRQLLEEMMFQPDIEPFRVGTPLKQHGCDEAFPTLARQQAGPGSGIATPLASDLLPFTRPAMRPVSGALKPTFIQIDQLGRPLCREDVPELMEIGPTLGRIPFSIPQSFFYASPSTGGAHTRWH